MVSGENEHPGEKIHDELEPRLSSCPPKLREYRICVPSLKERLLDQQTINPEIRKTQLFDFLKSNFRVSSPLAVFRRTVNRKERISLSVPSPAGIRRPLLHIDFIRSINWGSLLAYSKKWLKSPMNIALVLWLTCVATFGGMLGLLLLGLLNAAFPTISSRNHWIEIDNQVLNALFTLMSLYQHPNLFHHLVLLFRWGSEDIVELRKAYCKDGAYRPREWAHMTVVVALLHCTCVAQYALCGLYWGYPSETRPEFPENLFFVSGIVAPATAALYTIYSPLGVERESDSDDESTGKISQSSTWLPRTLDPRSPVIRPEWAGGMFDCKDDATLGFLSFFCTCCVFGWNAERLGFGNMYVHTVTFLLLCVAPLWVFSVTALNIRNYMIGDAMGIAGIVLCICGLLYGGYWRIQMRKKFKLPGDKSCCGSAKATDYFRWLFCWSCSLAQEVRTGNFYDVEEGNLVRKRIDYAIMIREECGTNSTTLLVSDDTMVLPPVQQLLGVEVKGASDGDAATAAAVKEAETGDCDEKTSDEDSVALVIKVEDGVINCETIEPTLSSTLLEAEDRNCESTT